jgi:uncharacterized protein YxeA
MKQTLLIITALMLIVGCGSSEKETEENMVVFVEGGTFQMGSNSGYDNESPYIQ